MSYEPKDFYTVLFSRRSSSLPPVLFRSATLLPSAVIAQTVHSLELIDHSLSGLLLPFSILIGLLTAFRVKDAFQKWDRAMAFVLGMHRTVREIMSRSLAYTGGTPEEREPRLERIRRWLLLAIVLMLKHARGNFKGDLKQEQTSGLLTDTERAFLLSKVTYSIIDNKQDRYPPRNRVAFPIDLLHQETTKMFALGLIPSFNHQLAIDAAIEDLSGMYEECEHLALTVMPLPYAQLTRAVSFAFLVLLPISVVQDTPIGTVIPFSFMVSCIYFALDHVASQMESPFGTDVTDVPFEKIVRRIEKHTAAQLASNYGRVMPNLDLYAETRTTDIKGKDISRCPESDYSKRAAAAMDTRFKASSVVVANKGTHLKARVRKVSATLRSWPRLKRGTKDTVSKERATQSSANDVEEGVGSSAYLGSAVTLPRRTTSLDGADQVNTSVPSVDSSPV